MEFNPIVWPGRTVRVFGFSFTFGAMLRPGLLQSPQPGGGRGGSASSPRIPILLGSRAPWTRIEVDSNHLSTGRVVPVPLVQRSDTYALTRTTRRLPP